MGYIETITGGWGGSASNNAAMAASAVLSVKMRFKGDVVANLPDNSFLGTELLLIEDTGGTQESFELSCNEVGSGNVRFQLNNFILSNSATASNTPKGSFSASSYYVAYAEISNTAPYIYFQITDDAGTVIGSQSASVGFNPGTTPSGQGVLHIGTAISGGNIASSLDGLAVYTAALAGAARYSTPAAGDANLAALYFFEDTSGTTATATVGNNIALSGGVLNTDYQWSSGGLWAAGGGGGGVPVDDDGFQLTVIWSQETDHSMW